MSDPSSGDPLNGRDKKDKNVISFPSGKERKTAEKQLKDKRSSEDKTEKDARKNRERLEEQYRQQYRQEQAARARLRSKVAQDSAQGYAQGKQPFINWEKIPPFARYMVGILICVQLFLSLAVSDADFVYIVMNYGFVPQNYVSGQASLGSLLLAPFTSLLIHGDWMHIVFNIVMLLAMGIFFERSYGTKRAIIFFILCGFSGHLMCFLLNPYSTSPVIGASGAISGLFAVTIITMSESGMMGPDAQRRGPLQFILLWTLVIIAFGVLTPGTSWQSHLGGFFGGIGFFYLWRRGIIKF